MLTAPAQQIDPSVNWRYVEHVFWSPLITEVHSGNQHNIWRTRHCPGQPSHGGNHVVTGNARDTGKSTPSWQLCALTLGGGLHLSDGNCFQMLQQDSQPAIPKVFQNHRNQTRGSERLWKTWWWRQKREAFNFRLALGEGWEIAGF